MERKILGENSISKVKKIQNTAYNKSEKIYLKGKMILKSTLLKCIIETTKAIGGDQSWRFHIEQVN